MRLRNFGLVATVLSMGQAAHAAGSAPHVITQPDWAVRPSGEAFARYYPALATVMGMTGSATISCTVSAEGRLVNCRPVAERPAGVGFGQAAVSIGGEVRMKPLALDGKPID